MKELLEKRDALRKELWAIDCAIRDYKDGFKYAVIVHSYGSHSRQWFNNLQAAIDEANEYNEDNGYGYIFTNNKEVNVRLNGGDVYYLENLDLLEYPYGKPAEAELLCAGGSSHWGDDDEMEDDSSEHNCNHCDRPYHECYCDEVAEVDAQSEYDELHNCPECGLHKGHECMCDAQHDEEDIHQCEECGSMYTGSCNHCEMDYLTHGALSLDEEHGAYMRALHAEAKKIGGLRENFPGSMYYFYLSQGYECITNPKFIQDFLERYDNITVNHLTKRFVVDAYGNYPCESAEFMILDEEPTAEDCWDGDDSHSE